MSRNVEDRLYSASLRPVDEGVRVLENKIASKIKAYKIADKKKAVMPLRPAYGSQGVAVTLWTNYVEMTISKGKDLVLYKYSISISPGESGRKQQRVIQLFVDKWRETLPTFGQVYSDFKTFLVSTTKLDLAELQVIKNSSMEYIRDGHADAGKNADTTHVAVVEPQGEFSVQSFLEYLCSEQAMAAFAAKLEIMQALNIFLNHYSKTNPCVVTVGANRTFNLKPKRPSLSIQQSRDRSAKTAEEVMNLGGGLEALRGFFTSIRPATGRLLINVNVTSAAFYKQGTLADLVGSFGMSSLLTLDKFLKRLRVEPTHLESKESQKKGAGSGGGENGTRRYRTIFGLAREGDGASMMPPHERPKIARFGAGPTQVQFWLTREGEKGRHVTVAQYFQQDAFVRAAYGITLKPGLPVINVGNREKPTYFPIDICEVAPGQVTREKLTPSQMERMVEFSAQRPWFNAEQITKFGLLTTGASNAVNKHLAQNKVTIGKQLITVPGRVLPQPKPQYRPGSQVSMSAGGWNMKNCQFGIVVEEKRARSWGCVTLYKGSVSNHAQVESQAEALRLHLAGAGLNLGRPGFRRMRVGESATGDLAALDGLFSGLKPSRTESGSYVRKTDFVLVVLPDKEAPLYNMIKYLADVVYGVATVCVARRTFVPFKGAEQMFGNLGLKINLKLGGANHKLDDSVLGVVAQGKTMIVGIDVTHPPAGAIATPSMAAMVASTDRFLAQWPGEVAVQTEPRREQVDALTSMLQNRLRVWRRRNSNTLPAQIIVYRDGVSEGQYAMVQQVEIPLLEAACTAEYGSAMKKPAMTVVVVAKRHHTRFYPTSTARSSMVKNNVAPGTVVDRGITEARTWDFFLQSHEALKGTGRPAHYIVLMDQIFRAGFERVQQEQQEQQEAVTSAPAPAPGGPRLMKLPMRGGGRGGGNHNNNNGRGITSSNSSSSSISSKSRSGGGGLQQPHNEADSLEMLTYSLCSVFGRATRSVSYATPAYFADILCERGRCWLAAYLEVQRPMDDAETASVLSAHEIRKMLDPDARKEAQQKLLHVQQQGRQAAIEACRVHASMKDTIFYI